MSFIQDEAHFVNYINKVAKSNEMEELLLPMEFYINEIYKSGVADSYTWALKEEGAKYLIEEYLIQWLSDTRSKILNELDFSHEFTEEFTALSYELRGLPGVYSFWTLEDKCLYIGMSKNIGVRMISSFGRFYHYNRAIFIKYTITKSVADARILEIYFINYYRPALNVKDNNSGDITLSITEIPEWGESTRCNHVISNIVGGE